MPSTSRRATLTVDQLEISVNNVRTNRHDSAPSEAFARTIMAFGLIHPLRVHPLMGNKHKFGVHAGARRLRTIKWLIDENRLPPDWPIEVSIREGASDADLLQESEVENRARTDLRDYELFLGVAKAHRRGATIEQIAMNSGEDEAEIRGWLRLGNLARPVFDALEAGAISVDQAKAYGATEDQALQLAAFEAVSSMPEALRTPTAIRERLGIGTVDVQRFLRLVGPEAYEAAGGRFERDLFAGDDPLEMRVLDPAILRDLVDARMGEAKSDIRVRTQHRDLRFIVEPPRHEFAEDWTLRVWPKLRSQDDALILPEGDVVACITLNRDGELQTTFWWPSRKAKADAERGPAPRPTANAMARAAVRDGAALDQQDGGQASGQANAMIREEEGLSQDGVQIFRSLRRAILRGRLVTSARTGSAYDIGGPALDYLIWSQLRLAVTDTRITQIGAGRITGQTADPEIAREHVRATEAWHVWSMALYELQQQTFLTDPDLAEAFRDYRTSATRLKQLAIVVVTGLSLERSLNGGGHRVAAHDALAQEIGLEDDAAIRALWTPTAEMFEKLLPKAHRLAIAEPLVERASFAPWSRLKSAELTKAVLAVVTGTSNVVRASAAHLAATWVHPLLRFDSDGDPDGDHCPPANDDAAQLDIEDAVREAVQ